VRQGRDELMVSMIWHKGGQKDEGVWWRPEEVEGAGLEQLSLLLGHGFTLGDDAPAH